MIGMPRAADIGMLVRCLADDGDLRIFFLQREILVDIDPTPAFGKRNMVFGRKLLAAKYRNAMGVYCLLHVIELRSVQAGQGYSGQFHTAIGR